MLIFPNKIKKGDTVGIVSLSDGVLGESFASHSLKLLEERLKCDLGLRFKYMNNALKGVDFLKNNPKARAEDLIQAFKDPEVDVIWTVIGGDDSFRLLPYLMNDEFREIVRNNPKIYIGMSDTTNTHLLLYKFGLASYYGPALLSDVAELGPEIHSYTKEWMGTLFNDTKMIKVDSSPIWYKGRESFGVDQLGVSRKIMREDKGFEFINGRGVIRGRLLGGCLDSLYESLVGGRYLEQKDVFEKYPIFPSRNEWSGKIVFLETSEECPTPSKFNIMMKTLEEQGVFLEARGMVFGKPNDETYYEQYRDIIIKFSKKYNLPSVLNMNFGHSTPRMMLIYGSEMIIDFNNREILTEV